MGSAPSIDTIRRRLEAEVDAATAEIRGGDSFLDHLRGSGCKGVAEAALDLPDDKLVKHLVDERRRIVEEAESMPPSSARLVRKAIAEMIVRVLAE